MNKRIKIYLAAVMIIASFIVVWFTIQKINGDNNGDDNGDAFIPGDYYVSTLMDYMGVVYHHRENITAFNEGYSSSAVCPWGFKHEGIDYFLENGSNVIAAIPGQVIDINLLDNGEEAENRYMIHMQIQFNASFMVDYCFEPVTNKTEEKDHQLALFNVQEGDWVEKGDKIATFLAIKDSAHIHFDNFENEQRQCPQKYFGPSDYTELMAMIHSFHSDWDLCYP